jgi:hypothetical protein
MVINLTVTTFKSVEGGPDHKAPEVVFNTCSIRISKYIYLLNILDKLDSDSVCLNGWAGQEKSSLR